MSGGRGEVHAAFVSRIVVHLLGRIVAPDRAEPAVPAVLADRRGRVVAPGDDADAEAPAAGVEVVGEEAAHRLLRRRQVVDRHRLHRRPRQDGRAAAQEHLGEGEEVVGGRHEPGAAGRECGRAAPLAVGGVEQRQRSRLDGSVR